MKLITVAIFPLPQEAYIIKSRLESEGIFSFLKDELTIQTDNFLSNAIGGVKLQVNEYDVEAATKILQDQGVELPQEIMNNTRGLMKDQKIVLVVGLSIICLLFLIMYFTETL